MAGLTLAQCETALSEALTARTAVMSGQAYSYNGRSVTRADLGQIDADIVLFDKLCQEKSGNRMAMRQICPSE